MPFGIILDCCMKKIIFLNYGSLPNDMILFVNKIINLINENNTEHKGIDKRHLISIEILFNYYMKIMRG